MNTQQQFVDTLHQLITDGDEVDRCYAIRSLATIEDQHSTEILIERLRDDDIDVCVDAAEALGKLGGQNAAEKLLESLINDPEGEIKTACIKALAELEDRNTIPHFIAFAEQRPEDLGVVANEWDVWWDLQLESVKALGNMQVREAIPCMKNIIEQDDFLDIENELYRALAQIGHEGDELLLSILSTGNSRARRRAAKALAHSQASGTLKPLARALQDGDADVRVAVLQSLPLRAHAISYMPVMLHLLKDQDADVRRAAIDAVQQLSQSSSTEATAATDQQALIEKLLPLLADTDGQVQAAAIHTLLQLGWESDRKHRDKIIALLANSEGDTFSAACRFIARHHLSEALPDLLQLFKKRKLDNQQKVRIMQTLGELGLWQPELETLLSQQLFDKNKAVRLSALEALASIDGAQADIEQTEANLLQPIDIMIEALASSLETPVALRPIPVTTSSHETDTDTGTTEADPSDSKEAEKDEDAESNAFVEKAFQEITQSIEDGETPQPMSTLDSMAISCVEQQLKSAAGKAADAPNPDTLNEEDKASLKEFLALSEANTKTANWLFSKEKVPLELDIQRLAARMISTADPIKAIPSLLAVYQSHEDSRLRSEILLSLGTLVSEPGQLATELLSKILQILDEALKDDDRNIRIAAARTLAVVGNLYTIEKLIACLDDEEVAMRIQCLNSIASLIEKNDGPAPDFQTLATQILQQFDNNEVGVHRAAINALLPLLRDRLNGDSDTIKEATIDKLIDAGLSGTDGQVQEMSRALNTLDQSQSSERLLHKLAQSPTSIERRFVMEMLGELYRPQAGQTDA